MASGIAITETELLDALAAAHGDGPPEARTISQMVADSGMGEKRVRRALALLKAVGRLEAHSLTRESLDGRTIRVPAFTILPG